jgi:hypothetical protein
MPGRTSQEKLLSRLHQEIGLDPNETAFVEVRNCDQATQLVLNADYISRVMVLALRLGKLEVLRKNQPLLSNAQRLNKTVIRLKQGLSRLW